MSFEHNIIIKLFPCTVVKFKIMQGNDCTGCAVKGGGFQQCTVRDAFKLIQPFWVQQPFSSHSAASLSTFFEEGQDR